MRLSTRSTSGAGCFLGAFHPASISSVLKSLPLFSSALLCIDARTYLLRQVFVQFAAHGLPWGLSYTCAYFVYCLHVQNDGTKRANICGGFGERFTCGTFAYTLCGERRLLRTLSYFEIVGRSKRREIQADLHVCLGRGAVAEELLRLHLRIYIVLCQNQ